MRDNDIFGYCNYISEVGKVHLTPAAHSGKIISLEITTVSVLFFCDFIEIELKLNQWNFPMCYFQQI